MSAIQGTNISAMVAPFDTADTYPTHSAEYGRGGFRSVNTVAARDAIPAPLRVDGMRVRVVNDPTPANNTDWDLIGGAWVLAPSGTASGVNTPIGTVQEIIDLTPLQYQTAKVASSGLILAGIDSLTDGAASSTWRSSFVPMLRGAAGDGGPGYHGFDFGISVDQGVGFGKTAGCQYITISDGIYGQYSLDGKGLYVAAGAGADNFSWTPASKWDTVRLFYFKQSGGGSFNYRLTNQSAGAATTVSTANASNALGFVDIPLSGTGNVGIVVEAITGNVAVFGGHFKLSNNAPTFGNIGTGGRTLQSVAAQNSALRQAWYANLLPSHIFINAGMNDRATRTAAQHNADLTAFITDIQTASPNTNIVLVQSNEPSDAATTNFLLYVAQKKLVAAARNTSYLDVRTVLGNYAQAVAQGLMADGVHPSAKSNLRISQAKVQALGLSRALRDPGLTPYSTAPAPTLQREGKLTTVYLPGVAAGATTTLWNLGFINGFPTFAFRLRIAGTRNGTSATTFRDFAFTATNGTSVNVATAVSAAPSNVLLLKELAGDSQGADFTLGLSIVSGKALLTITPISYTTNLIAQCDWMTTSNAVAGQAVYEN